MPPEPGAVTLVIDLKVGGRILRKVGPSAWVVLHGLAARATPTSRGNQVRTNVRELGAELGISKDTVARAVNKLIVAKIIRRSGFEHDEAGRFATRIYHVDLNKAGLQVHHGRSQPDTGNHDTQVHDMEDRPPVGASPKPLGPPPPPIWPATRRREAALSAQPVSGLQSDDLGRPDAGVPATVAEKEPADNTQPSLFGDS